MQFHKDFGIEPEPDPRISKHEVLEPSTEEDDRRLREEYKSRMDEVLKLVNAQAGYPCRDLPKSLDLPANLQDILLNLAIGILLNDGKDVKEVFGLFGRFEVTPEKWIDTMLKDTMSKEPFEPLGITDLIKYLQSLPKSRSLEADDSTMGCCLGPLWDWLIDGLEQLR